MSVWKTVLCIKDLVVNLSEMWQEPCTEIPDGLACILHQELTFTDSRSKTNHSFFFTWLWHPHPAFVLWGCGHEQAAPI
eukprot:m.287630 g.287630  ORF g.287630 m.287630 type:complete len:79 (-) comp15791_c0_seq1:219-455(-)